MSEGTSINQNIVKGAAKKADANNTFLVADK